MGAKLKPLESLLHWLAGPRAVRALFVLYLIPRVAILFLDLEPFSDATWYFHRAVGLAAGYGYSEGGVLTAYWPPGWPLTLGLLFKFFGDSIIAAQFFNLACSLATAWLTLDLGRRLFNSELAGRVALFLLAVYPNNVGYVPQLMTEVFYTLLLLTGCWLLMVTASGWALFLAGLVFGLATLVKAQSLVALPLVFAIEMLRDKITLKKALRVLNKAAIVFTLAIAVVLPWSYRNYKIFGEWILVSTNGGLTLLTGNNPSARGGYTPADLSVTSIPRSVATQVEVDKEARRRAVQWIKENPGQFVALLPLKVFRLWAPDGEAEWGFQAGYRYYDIHAFWFRAVRYLNQAYYFCLLLGFVVAGALLFGRKIIISQAHVDWWALPYAVAFYPTLIAVIFSGQSRFHYPVMPFVVMSCGWLIVATSRSAQEPTA